MGKAKRILVKNLEDNYAKNNQKYNESENNTDIFDDSCQKTAQDIHSEKVYNASLSIHNQLLEYAQKYGVPICEYLSYKELENYVIWMQKQ